jgi:hypothetical protein
MKKSNFNPVQIPQDLLTNPLVSLSAKGLYAFLQIFNEDGQMDFEFMCKAYNIDKNEFDHSMDELIHHKYVSIETQFGLLVYVLNGI